MHSKQRKVLDAVLIQRGCDVPIGPLVDCISKGRVKLGRDGILCVMTPRATLLLGSSGEKTDVSVASIRTAAQALSATWVEHFSFPIEDEGNLWVDFGRFGQGTLLVFHEDEGDERWFDQLEEGVAFWRLCSEREDGLDLAMEMLFNDRIEGPGLLYIAKDSGRLQEQGPNAPALVMSQVAVRPSTN